MTTLSVSLIPLPTSTNPPSTSLPISSHKFPQFAFNYPLQSPLHLGSPATVSILFTRNCLGDEGDITGTVDDLRVPPHWSQPSLAFQESEWLRVALHKWLDDEYCPELTNVDISRVAANSYYQSLLQNTTDLGEI